MPLPNFELHVQQLVPERLIVGDARLWTRAPIPAGFGWWRQGWFPRSTVIVASNPNAECIRLDRSCYGSAHPDETGEIDDTPSWPVSMLAPV
jgi:hypothetical protein